MNKKNKKESFEPSTFWLTEVVDLQLVKNLLLGDLNKLPDGGNVVEYLVKQLSVKRDVVYSTNKESPEGRRYASSSSLQYRSRLQKFK